MTLPASPPAASPPFAGISHVLLDIEGTTCPVSFVAEVLFPFAAERLPSFLNEAGATPTVRALVEEVEAAWQADPHPEARRLRAALTPPSSVSPGSSEPDAVVPYLLWLIRADRKLAALKELQGMVWARGYEAGILKAPLYPDVPQALRRWNADGLTLAVYSSGSVAAQKLIYRFSEAGDLSTLFSHWFDTRSGSKQEPQSYRNLCEAMGVSPHKVLFVSDALAEIQAAAGAGLSVVFSLRSDNPHQDPGGYPWIGSLGDLRIAPATITTTEGSGEAIP